MNSGDNTSPTGRNASVEALKSCALVRHWYEDVLSGTVSLAAQKKGGNYSPDDWDLNHLFAPHYINHVVPAPPDGWKTGVNAAKQIIRIYRLSFPDLTITIDEQMFVGDKVITRYTASGTLTAKPFFGQPATGGRYEITGVGIDRIRNGKFDESWGVWDAHGLLQQMGILPEMTTIGC
jgi:predicted ester cyclase